MAVHIVFVRFCFGFSRTFPCDRFLPLKDDEIGPALEKLRQEWLAIPENMAELKRREKERRKWNRGALAQPGINYFMPKKKAKATSRKRASEPTFEDVASVAGWRGTVNISGSNGFSHPYPLALFDSKDKAEAACSALQFKADDMVTTAESKGAVESDDRIIADANPHFYVITDADLAPGEIFTVREKIERLYHTGEQIASVEGVFLRPFLPGFRRILEMCPSNEPAPTSIAGVSEAANVKPFSEIGPCLQGASHAFVSSEEIPMSSTERKEPINSMKPAEHKAYLAYEYAGTKAQAPLADKEAYSWIKENGISGDDGDGGQLADYQLPSFATWSRQLRAARQKLCESKYQKRGTPRTTRSIVKETEI